jgi:LysR family transcriptional regulator, nitrogen assimilation regulatory protein
VEFRQLEYFVQIARQHGFSRAAAHLYVAQSALSRQITLLEQELGVSLLLRTGRGVQLTEAGEIFLAHAESIIRQCRQVRQDVAPSEAPRGELSLGMPPSLTATLATPLLSELRRRYPYIFVDVWIETSILLREFVLRGKLDIAVLGMAEHEAILNTEAVVTEDLFLVGPKTAILDINKAMSISDAASMPLILTSRPNSIRVLVEAALRQHGSPNIVMEVNSVPLSLELVAAGIGHTVLPFSAIKGALEKHLLTASKIKGLSLDWVIATSRERPLAAGACRAQELIRQVIEAAITTEAWPYARRP